MKRVIIFIGILLLFTTNMVLAETATLIDFSQLEKDYATGIDETDPQKLDQNQRTLINYGNEAGSGFTDEDRKKMLTSLAIDNWRVTLASSSRTVARQSLCYTKEAKTSPNADDFEGEDMKEKTIMGIRIRFPESAFNSYAEIKPPFEIQAYQDMDTVQADGSLVVEDADKGNGDKFEGFGVLKNVGVIKNIEVMVYGANYPHALEIVLMDETYQESRHHICYLDFDGWGRRTWTNPNYIADVRNRELQKYPLYPRSVPYVKFNGFVIYRDGSTMGGDFITYFKDVKVTYDLAVSEIDNPQINDERIWHILEDRNTARKQAEYKRLGARMVLEMLEQAKMHKDE
jgi:hypothetical protein